MTVADLVDAFSDGDRSFAATLASRARMLALTLSEDGGSGRRVRIAPAIFAMGHAAGAVIADGLDPLIDDEAVELLVTAFRDAVGEARRQKGALQ